MTTKPAMTKLHSLAKVVLLTFVVGVVSPSAWAADKSGCKDIPGIKRFEGSSLVLCSKKNFAEYTLPTGKIDRWDFDNQRLVGLDKQDLEGKLVQNVYEVPVGASSAQVFRNYTNDLKAKGFKILYEAKQLDTKPLQQYFSSQGPGGQIFGYSEDEARYVAAVKEEDDDQTYVANGVYIVRSHGPKDKEESGAKTYVALYIVEYRDGLAPNGITPMKGQVYVRLDALTVGELKDEMVTTPGSK